MHCRSVVDLTHGRAGRLRPLEDPHCSTLRSNKLAGVAELADARDSKSRVPKGRVGSTPTSGIMRPRWYVIGWTGLAIVGWLLSGTVWAGQEARCEESTDLFCFSTREVWGITGAGVGMVWLAGLFVIGAVVVIALVRRRLRRADRTGAAAHGGTTDEL